MSLRKGIEKTLKSGNRPEKPDKDMEPENYNNLILHHITKIWLKQTYFQNQR